MKLVVSVVLVALVGGGALVEAQADGNGFAASYSVVTVGGVEAKGVGLRSLGSGTITLTDVPAGAQVLRAYLYWQILDDVEQPLFASVWLNGETLEGELLSEGDGLCWGPTHTYAYRADATGVINGPGSYLVEAVESGLTDGSSVISPKPIAEGASLVVVWQDLGGRLTEVVLMDGFQDMTVGGEQQTITFPLFALPVVAPLSTASLWAMGGDGQSNAADATRVNGVLVGQNTWDGSDPQRVAPYSIGNLWDTDRFDVTGQVKPGMMTRVVVQSIEDCLGPTAFVLAHQV